jgi:tetratricopeptide (TPR) repeat protein
MSSASLGRFVVGLCVGIAVGFFAANAFNRSRKPTPPPASASDPAPAQAAANTASAPEDLTDDELKEKKAIVDARKDDFDAQYNLAEYLLRIRRTPEEAVPYYRRASELQPKNPQPLVGLGDASFAAALAAGAAGAGDPRLYDDAAANYTRALALDPKASRVHATLGLTRLLRRPAEYPKAIKEFRTALELEPENAIALQGLATALAETGDVAGAEAAVAKLEAVDPQSPSLEAAREAVAKAKSSGR